MEIFNIENICITVLDYPLSYVELIGTLSGLICVSLATKKNILTWPIGIINVIFFFAIFYQVQLYSDMFLQVFFGISSIYGWIVWKKEENAEIQVCTLSNKARLNLLVLIILSFLGLGYFISHLHQILPNLFPINASYPYADAFIAIASVIATILMAKKYLECWISWVLIDVFSVYIYWLKEIIFISIEYGIFLMLAASGFVMWSKSVNKDNALKNINEY